MADSTERIARLYRFFAGEARGRSALYGQVSAMVAADGDLIAFLAAQPEPKRQPNLFYAAVQYLFGAPADAAHFRALVLDHPEQVATVMAARTTQTNQPARCATLLPALARIPGPLALLEVGASAGLCLLPDRYDYLFALADGRESVVRRTDRDGLPPAPEFACRLGPGTPVPAASVEVVWRAGLDLSPLDVADPDARAWLDALVWPGEERLRANLHRALDVAAADPPPVRRGDLRTDLGDVAAAAPLDATLVVFHTAVLAYVDDADDRERFAAAVDTLREHRRLVWLANENVTRIPRLPPETAAGQPLGEFLLCGDGRPLARTDPHGASLTWLASG